VSLIIPSTGDGKKNILNPIPGKRNRVFPIPLAGTFAGKIDL
jgi:hypothetical protein